MDDKRTRITIGHRLLFAATDTRSMGVVLGVMTVTLLSSFVFGSRTRVVYPWTARAAAVDPVEALPSDDGFVTGAEVAAIEARDMRAEPPSVEAAEDGATALAPEIAMPDVVDRKPSCSDEPKRGSSSRLGKRRPERRKPGRLKRPG